MIKATHQIGPLFVLVVAGLLAPGQSVRAASVTWEKDFRRAARKSDRLNKPMLLEFTASWCGYCHKMRDTTFTDKRIIKHLNACFIPVVVDADENEELMKAIGVEGLPTTVIVSPDLKILKKITGYRTADQLEAQLGPICREAERKMLTNTKRKPVPATPTSTNSPRAKPMPARHRAQLRRTVSLSNAQPGPVCVFRQLCLVSMLEDAKLTKGKAEYTSVYRGKTLCFASADHMRRFESDPAHYWPVFGGTCPVATADGEDDSSGDPRFAAIYRGRLWFLSDNAHRRAFAERPAYFLRAASR